jgi:long-chain acyl-CoA synthetase
MHAVPLHDSANMADLLFARGADEDIVIIDGPRHYSYAELRHAAGRIVAELRALDLPPGARIGLLSINSFFWIAAYIAGLKVGTVVPFSDKTAPEDLAIQADWVRCSAVLLDRRHQRRVGHAFGDRPVITDGCLAAEGPADWPLNATGPDADAALMFTSGTTSRPKGVRITHGNLLANTADIVSYLDLGPADRMLSILSFHYCFGASLLHTHLAVGGSIVLCNSFAFPQTAVDLIEREACTGLAGVPSSFQLLLRTSDYATRTLPSLRLVQQAGGHLAPGLIRELAAAQPNSRLFVMYGQTEATARLSYLPPERLPDKLGSIGRGLRSVSLTVVDDAGEPVPTGTTGEIWAKGLSISPGYYNDPDATADKFPRGGLRTGDLATVDEDGFIYIVGRRDDFIKTWGYRVSGQQVETEVLQLPGILGAGAIGLPDEASGEAVTLAVTLAPGATLTPVEVLAFLRERLPKYAVPKTVHIIDNLPLTASGKVARQGLRGFFEKLAEQIP